MSYRGPALQYKIRKTTTGNKTGDNYSITIPRIIAKKFENCYFKLDMSGNCLLFESGCKITIGDLEVSNPNCKMFIGAGEVVFS